MWKPETFTQSQFISIFTQPLTSCATGIRPVGAAIQKLFLDTSNHNISVVCLKHSSCSINAFFFFKESFSFFFFNFNFIYLWLCWVFVSVRGLSLVVARGGHSSSRCAGLSLSRPLLLRSTGSRRAGSVILLTGSVAPRHVGSSQTRARTRVPCIGRQILNHCATREAPQLMLFDMI